MGPWTCCQTERTMSKFKKCKSMKNSYSFLVLPLFYLLLSCNSLEKQNNQTSPNIILIMADDLGYETITANGGNSYSTPAIDEMAASGMRFEHCYAQPLCTPSRVKIMTGIYNVRNYQKFGFLDDKQTTFGHLFRDAGYATCIVGKWQLGKDSLSPHNAGFDEHCLWQLTKGRTDGTARDTRFSQPVLEVNGTLNIYNQNEFGPKVVSDYALDFIRRQSLNKKPFFLYYPMLLTHCPFSPTPDSPEWQIDTQAVMTYKGQAKYFKDMMAYTDKIVGSINDQLQSLGIAEHTLVIFTADNGTDKPIVSQMNKREVVGAKGKSTDAGTRVPLIVKWDQNIQAEQVSNSLIDLSDILPTICAAANIEVPEVLDIDGWSFLPELLGREGEKRKWVYNWYSRSGEEDKAVVFARNHDYKLYQSGAFHYLPNDWLEEHPLNLDQLNKEEQLTYEMLDKVLKQYQKRRLENLEDISFE